MTERRALRRPNAGLILHSWWMAFGTCLLALCVLLPTTAAAQDGPLPCNELSAADGERYLELGDQAIAAYKDADYTTSVSLILDAIDICDEDPRTSYNLARAYHKAGNCNMALFWYEQVLEMDPDGTFEWAIKEQRRKAGRYKTELQVECANSARLSVECSNDNVEVTVGEFSTRRCPFQGRVDAGTYKLVARLEGHESYSAQVQLVAGENNRLLVPQLEVINAQTDMATLRVSCPDDIDEVALYSADLSETLECPGELQVNPGVYTVEMDGAPAETFKLSKGQVMALQLQRGSGNEVDQIGLFIGLRIAPGVGLASGDLYTDNNEEKFGETLDGLQPTLLTTAIENEVGYLFNDWVGLGAQVRFEIANLAVMALVFARFIPVNTSWFALRFDLGAGGGRILASVEIEDGQRPIARMGPGFGSGGISAAFKISRIFAIVAAVETRVGFPDFGVHFDLGVGVEITF